MKFSFLLKHNSICALLAMVGLFGLQLEQLDVKTTFLHCELEETIYVDQPNQFIFEGKEDHNYRLVSHYIA